MSYDHGKFFGFDYGFGKKHSFLTVTVTGNSFSGLTVLGKIFRSYGQKRKKLLAITVLGKSEKREMFGVTVVFVVKKISFRCNVDNESKSEHSRSCSRKIFRQGKTPHFFMQISGKEGFRKFYPKKERIF